MAKNTSTSTSTPTSQPANPSSTSQPLSEKEQLRKLFEQYEDNHSKLLKAKEDERVCVERQSEILQAMIDLYGTKKDYTVDGKPYGIIVRRGKTLFFRGRGSRETVEL